MDILFFSNGIKNKRWKMVIPKNLEGKVIRDYHNRYGHMGTKKVVNTLEHVYMKGVYTKSID